MEKNVRMQMIAENEPIFRNAFNNFENGYAILQLPIEVPYKFRGYGEIVKYLEQEPNRADYNILYADAIEDLNGMEDDQINEVLENIFMIYNVGNRPDNYYGTSLSVSDVVVLKINNEVNAYYVDNFGFEKLRNFEV